MTLGSQAQTAPAGAGRTFSITPTLSLSETITSNSRASSSRRGESESITTASAGLQVRRTGGRITGALNYSLSGFLYARDSDENNFQHSLNAFGTAELIENRAFIDATATVSRQLLSAFGTQLGDDRLASENQAEVATYSISPYVRGALGGSVAYVARLSYAATRSDRDSTSDSNVTSGTLQFNGGNARRVVTWSATLGRQIYDFSEGRETESDTARGVLSFVLDPQFTVSVIGGRESNNFTDLEKDSRSTHGFGIAWRPTERTRLTAERERRFFGDAHSVSFDHRMRRSAIRFSSSRGIVSDPQRFSTRSLGTAFDLFFLQFASIEPDPILREQLVNNFLRANGISPTTVVVGGFLSSGVTLDRRHDLSFSLLGVRDTVTFTATRNESRRVDTVALPDDDFADASVIEQRGFSVNWARRLTPLSSINFGLLQNKTTGSLSSQETELRTFAVTWSSRLNKRSTVSLGARHSRFESESDPYSENALTGSVSMSF